MSDRPPLAFYCVTGRDFFPGAVAMLNSLRLLGYDEPVYVCDCGMTADQRVRLEGQVIVVDAPGGAAPSTQKLVAPLAHPAEVMVLLDADLIVTRALGEPIAAAAEGRVVAFENDVARHFDEWSELFGLPTIRPGPYMSSGAILAGGEPGADLLAAMAERLGGIDAARTWVGGGGDPSDPLFLFDQDLFNAVAHSLIAADRVRALPAGLAPIPPFDGVRLEDAAALRCRGRDGTQPYLLHHASHKPWLVRMRTNVYSRLLTRLLLEPDVAIRLDPDELPLRLRTGAAARAERARTDLLLTGPGIARRLRGRPDPIPAWPDRGSP